MALGSRPCGSIKTTTPCPPPCGEYTTRKKLTRHVNGPDSSSLRYMPGFSPDQSTTPGWISWSAMYVSSSAGDRRCGRDAERRTQNRKALRGGRAQAQLSALSARAYSVFAKGSSVEIPALAKACLTYAGEMGLILRKLCDWE